MMIPNGRECEARVAGCSQPFQVPSGLTCPGVECSALVWRLPPFGRAVNLPHMKTAYELIMERLNRESPLPKLTDAQKKQIAELDSLYRAKIAELELSLGDQIRQAMASGDVVRAESLQQELSARRKKLEAELEEKKEVIRRGVQ